MKFFSKFSSTIPVHNATKPSPERLALPFSRGYFDWILFCVVAYVGFVFAWYVYSLGLTLIYIDQYSHLVIARQVTDGLTTGLSQIGFWPPLLHILLAPFTALWPLYASGLAAAVVLVPLLAFASVVLFRLLYLLCGSYLASAIGTAAFALNPYVLYFAVTPMMETLYLVMLVCTTYFFVHWWYTSAVSSLALTGVFVSLATMARFEGFFLVPIIGVFVLYRLWAQGTTFYRLEANVHLYSGLAVLGVVFIFAYGFLFGGDPLAFMHSQWSAGEQQKDFARPAQGDVSMAMYYLLRASMDIIGASLVVLACVSFAISMLLERERRMLCLALGAILFSPFLFDWLALYMGSIVIYIPDLPPFNIVFNERYGLNWIIFIVLFPVIAATALFSLFAKSRFTLPFGMVAASVVGIIMLSSTWTQFRAVACSDCFTLVRSSWLASKEWRQELPNQLAAHYDGGLILVTRAFFNETVALSGIPVEQFIHESSEHYYQQALDKPWLFARFVVMFNPDDPSIPNWEANNEKISEIWAYSDEFHEMYELVYEGHTDRLYRLREEKLREYLAHYGIDEASVPSLSQEPALAWNVETSYDELIAQIDKKREPFFVERVNVEGEAESTEEHVVSEEFTNGSDLVTVPAQ